MGADLYIESVFEPTNKKYEKLFKAACEKRDASECGSAKEIKAQKQVDKYYDLMYSQGYFGDSYNSSCFLWQVGLSWWVDVAAMCNKKGYMSVSSMKKLKKMLEDRKLPSTVKEWKRTESGQKLFVEIDAAKRRGYEADTPGAFLALFRIRRIMLIAFLDQAISLKEPARFSL
jgi:hypothetical protein